MAAIDGILNDHIVHTKVYLYILCIPQYTPVHDSFYGGICLFCNIVLFITSRIDESTSDLYDKI